VENDYTFFFFLSDSRKITPILLGAASQSDSESSVRWRWDGNIMDLAPRLAQGNNNCMWTFNFPISSLTIISCGGHRDKQENVPCRATNIWYFFPPYTPVEFDN